MVYPAIVLVIASGVVGFLLMFVVPTFAEVYKKMHLELPWITRLLLGASGLAVRLWWVPVLGGGGVALGWKPLLRVERFRRGWDRLMLVLPLFGRVRRMAITTRFLSAFSTLTGSGVTVVEALRVMSNLAVNVVAGEAITDIRNRVRRGGKVADAMERYVSLFSPMAVQMVGVGEQTGTLPEATARTAEFIGHELETKAKALTTLLEPLLTVGLGLVVGTIALAIYLPMFDLIKHVSH
jgi:type IV pilus assembly protein PilC